MIMFQMIWKTFEMHDHQQFQAHLWHPNNANIGKMQKNIHQDIKVSLGGGGNDFRFEKNMELY